MNILGLLAPAYRKRLVQFDLEPSGNNSLLSVRCLSRFAYGSFSRPFGDSTLESGIVRDCTSAVLCYPKLSSCSMWKV